jgi:hypothetical protein
MQALSVNATAFTSKHANLYYKQTIMDDSSFRQSVKKPTATPPLPLIVKIAIAVTFLNTMVILFAWPGLLLRVCF